MKIYIYAPNTCTSKQMRKVRQNFARFYKPVLRNENKISQTVIRGQNAEQD